MNKRERKMKRLDIRVFRPAVESKWSEKGNVQGQKTIMMRAQQDGDVERSMAKEHKIMPKSSGIKQREKKY